MARVTVEDCLEKVPNRFALTVLASRRARSLAEGRGTPLVKCSNKPAVTALREIAKGGVRYLEEVDEAMLEYIEEQRVHLRGTAGMDHTFIDAAAFGPIGSDEGEEEEEDDDVKELTADLESLGTGGEEEDEKEVEEVEEPAIAEAAEDVDAVPDDAEVPDGVDFGDEEVVAAVTDEDDEAEDEDEDEAEGVEDDDDDL